MTSIRDELAQSAAMLTAGVIGMINPSNIPQPLWMAIGYVYAAYCVRRTVRILRRPQESR